MRTKDIPVRINPDDEYSPISLMKILGDKKIVDIEGFIWGQDEYELRFHMNKMILDDGTEFWCEGAHDDAYIYEYNSNVLDLKRFWEPEEEDE